MFPIINIKLGRRYQHKIDEHIFAVPFNVADGWVEITLDRHGGLDTGAMSIPDFLEQFEMVKPD
jgi:hypothetical protein